MPQINVDIVDLMARQLEVFRNHDNSVWTVGPSFTWPETSRTQLTERNTMPTATEAVPTIVVPHFVESVNNLSRIKQLFEQAAQRVGSSGFRQARDLLMSNLAKLREAVYSVQTEAEVKTDGQSWLRARKLPQQLQAIEDLRGIISQKAEAVTKAAQGGTEVEKADAFLRKQLLVLLDEGAEITVDGILKITQPIVLEHEDCKLDLGRLAVILKWDAIGNPKGAASFKVQYHDGGDENRTNVTLYCHPHVHHNGEMCIGGAGDDGPYNQVQQSLGAGDLTYFFDLIESTLRTYNDQSPICEIWAWVDPDREDESRIMCPLCENTWDRDDMYYCEACDERTCPDCITSATGRHDYICTACVQGSCEDCDLTVSDVATLVHCECCGVNRCGGCHANCECTSCDTCNDDICGEAAFFDEEDCAERCEDCYNDVIAEREAEESETTDAESEQESTNEVRF